MPLPKEYKREICSMARALEVLGERWTLLIVRDAFFGVRRFSDFAGHLGVPRAVLANRLESLTEAGVLDVVAGDHGHDEYELTAKGRDLWPVVRSLLDWGESYYSPRGPRRIFLHDADGGEIGTNGRCASCGGEPNLEEMLMAPGPGLPKGRPVNLVNIALATPHRMLTPIR